MIINRIIKNISVDLSSVKSVDRIKPSKISFSLGSHINIFSWIGVFWSKDIGSYDAYITNTNDLIFITTTEKKIIISPSEPEKIINKLTNFFMEEI